MPGNPNLHAPHAHPPSCPSHSPTPRIEKNRSSSPLNHLPTHLQPQLMNPPYLWRTGVTLHATAPRSTQAERQLAQGLAVGFDASQNRRLRLFADPGSWVASGIAQFWNLMQERSHGNFDFDASQVGRCTRKILFLLSIFLGCF